jgi:hypothetical protein
MPGLSVGAHKVPNSLATADSTGPASPSELATLSGGSAEESTEGRDDGDTDSADRHGWPFCTHCSGNPRIPGAAVRKAHQSHRFS